MLEEQVPPITYKGSVKNIRHNEEDPFLFFEFSDRYSIYDWGEMPDGIEGKGSNIARFTDKIYSYLEDSEFWKNWDAPSYLESNQLEELRKNGLLTHRYNMDARKENLWKVNRVYIPKILDKDYSFFLKRPESTLVPLEIIFRFGLPKGSSFLKRAKKNPEYVKSLGIKSLPEENEKFDQAVIEFSTKLEAMDTYLDTKTVKQISSMNEKEFDTIKCLSSLIAYRLKDFFSQIHLELWDGKFEFAFMRGVQNRKFMLVDSIALDEVRLMYKDMPLSKEILRQAYWGSDWYKKIDTYKKQYKDNWKEEMQKANINPPKLASKYKNWVEQMYQIMSDIIDHPELAQVKLEELYQTYVSEIK